jgi:hypothetical protein
MPIQEIRDKLKEWKSEQIYPDSKSFRELNSPIVPGEFYFILDQRTTINLGGHKKQVLIRRTFHTQTLSPEPLSQNPSSDLYILERLLPAFDNEFLQSVENEITSILQEINPDGFF